MDRYLLLIKKKESGYQLSMKLTFPMNMAQQIHDFHIALKKLVFPWI